VFLNFVVVLDFSTGDDERVYRDDEQSLDWDEDEELRTEGVGVGVEDESEFIIADRDKYGLV
jgi:hypothetical protein